MVLMKRTVRIAQSMGLAIPALGLLACLTTAIIAQESPLPPAPIESGPVPQARIKQQTSLVPQVVPQSPFQQQVPPAPQNIPPFRYQPQQYQPLAPQGLPVPAPANLPQQITPAAPQPRLYRQESPTLTPAKPVVVVSSLIFRIDGELEAQVSGPIAHLREEKNQKNPIIVVSQETAAAFERAAMARSLEVISRPQLRITSGNTGRLQMAIGGKGETVEVFSLRVKATLDENSAIDLEVMGGPVVSKIDDRKGRTVHTDSHQPVLVLLESKDGTPQVFAMIKSRVFSDIKSTTAMRTRQHGYPRPDVKPAINSLASQPGSALVPQSIPFQNEWRPIPSQGEWQLDHPTTQPSYRAQPPVGYPPRYSSPQNLQLSCMPATRLRSLQQAIHHLRQAGSKELAKKVEAELKQEKLAMMKAELKRKHQEIQVIESAIKQLESSVSNKGEQQEVTHSLEVKKLQMPISIFRAAGIKASSKSPSPTSSYSLSETLKKPEAEKILARLSKIEGVGNQSGSKASIRGVSAIAMDGISFNASHLGASTIQLKIIDQIAERPGIRLAGFGRQYNSISITAEVDQVVILTVPAENDTVKLYAIGFKKFAD
jgi:hypothetical protein